MTWDGEDDGEDWGDSLGREGRGCGKRQKGGVYAEVPFNDSDGYPIEHFLQDPPTIIDPAAMGVAPVGVTMIERGGVHHLVDWVGSKHYPNVWDYIEETRRLGASRRLPKTLDFSKLTSDSRILFVHARAGIANPVPFWYGVATQHGAAGVCPKDIAAHDGEFACIGLCQHDIEGATDDGLPAMAPGQVFRRVGKTKTTYYGWARPDGVDPDYRPAIFMSLPLRRLAVIDGPGADKALKAASKTGVPVKVWDE